MSPSVPVRLEHALAALPAWADLGVHFAPIRHHSPGCSLALEALLAEVRPDRILIEGPREFDAALPALQDPGTVPPVALLSVADGRAGFYPLADFSPEWVALRWAAAHDSTVTFIDRSFAEDTPAEAAVTLQAEHQLARSAALQRLALTLGCRDHDDVWEHLFEDRPTESLTDWRGFFSDVLAWAGLARLEAGRSDLDADGTHAREAVMASALTAQAGQGSVVVVTGAFHTLPLLEVLDDHPEAVWVTDHAVSDAHIDDPSWLIRYDFTRLDGLRGYGAGMPSPGFWQRAWDARHDGLTARRFATSTVVDIASAVRSYGEPLGTSQTAAAVEQVLRLAALRGRSWPGRTDVLDGILSTLAKDETGLSGTLGQSVASIFARSDLGSIPDGLASPPLVAEAHAEATRWGFRLTDADPKRASFDTTRKPQHRQRREFCARMRFLETGFARQLGGADVVARTGLGLRTEEWEYAWTPAVERALIDASTDGPTLDTLLTIRIAARLADSEATLDTLTSLLAELLVMGESRHVPAACQAMAVRLADASRLDAVVASLHGLATLTEGRVTTPDPGLIESLTEQGLAVAAYLVAGLGTLDRDEALHAIDPLIGLRDLVRRLPEAAGSAAVSREFERLRDDRHTPAILVGCLVGMASTAGTLDGEAVTATMAGQLTPGADPERVADFLVGLLRAAPDALLYAPERVETVTEALTALPELAFVAALPDLRRAFTGLSPTQTHQLAQLVAGLTGAAESDIDVVLTLSPAESVEGSRIEQRVVAGLIRDGLEGLVSP